MKTRDLAKLSTRMFKARTSRTLLTILGMGVGISAILFLVGLGYGIQNTLLETITTSDSLLTLDVFPQKAEDRISMETINEIKNFNGVSQIIPIYQTKAQIKSADFTSDTGATISDPGYFSLSGMKIEKGKGMEEPNGVVISSTFAKIFDKEPQDLIGQEIKFSLSVFENGNSEKSTVVDLEKPFKVLGYVDSKDVMIYINNNDIKDQVSISEFSGLKVKCQRSDYIESVKNSIVNLGFNVSALNDIVNQANKVFAIVRIILGFFGMVALMVSAIGMFNTMTVTLLERTEEIGIMKSIGAYDKNILAMFVFESTVMGFLGGVSGIIIAIVTGKIFNIFVNMVAHRFGGYSVSLFYYPFWFVLFIVFSAIFVGFVTGLVPAKKASSIDPLDALRYK